MMLISTKDIDPMFTSEGFLVHDPTDLDMFLIQHSSGIPMLPLTTLLWVFSCGRFRVNWNTVAEAENDPAVGFTKISRACHGACTVHGIACQRLALT